MPFALKERFTSYTEPWESLQFAAWYFLQGLSKGFSGALDRGFMTWYTNLGPHFANYEQHNTSVPRLVGMAKGVVLDVGPGTGNQLPRFNIEAIQQIYGIEPNAAMLDSLTERVAQFPDLKNVYIPICAALEDEALLAAKGILPGTIDTVVCMQVLCSVSDPARAVRKIHLLLKPGGQLLFWEHEAGSDVWTRRMQRIWNIVWTPLIGGCCLGRDIEGAIFNSAQWSVVELRHDTSGPYSLMPRVWGRLIRID